MGLPSSRAVALVLAGAVAVALVLAWSREGSDEPILTRDARPGAVYRVEGTLRGEPRLWRVPGSDEYVGAGAVLELDDRGEALLLAEQPAVDDLRSAVAQAEDGRVSAVGRVVETVSPEQVTFYGFRLDDFPPVAGGRLLVLLEP
jgi:hypothetical protein